MLKSKAIGAFPIKRITALGVNVVFLESLKVNIKNNLPDILNRKEIEGRPQGSFVREIVGPIALSKFVKENNIPHKVLPYAQFNPVGKFNFDFIQTYHYGTGNWGGDL